VKKLWSKGLVLLGAGAFLALILAWATWSSLVIPSSSIKGIALRAASGDTNAAAALQKLGARAVPELVDLLRWNDPFLRRQAHAISPKLPSRLRHALMARVRPMDAGRMRVAGAKGLALLGPQADAAIPALLLTVRDSEPYISMEAASALARVGVAALPGLIEALSDTNPVVRHAAAYGLGEMGSPAEAAYASLAARLEDPDLAVRTSAAYSMSLIGFSDITVISNLFDHANPAARNEAMKEFLRLFASFRGLERPLAKMVKGDDSASRISALQALAAIRTGDSFAVQSLSSALEDPVASVRTAAVKGLSTMAVRSRSVVDALSRSTNDPDPEVRDWAARALKTLVPAEAPPTNASLGGNHFNTAMPADVARRAPHLAPISKLSDSER
jgi:HEAT repeat protein